MAPSFRIAVVRQDEIPSLTGLTVPTFAHYPLEVQLGNVDTPTAIKAASARHLRAWQDHLAETGEMSGIACMARDPASGKETMVACAYWYIFAHPRTAQAMENPNFLLSADWIDDDDEREKLRRCFRPVVDVRKKWLAGRGHAVLMYLATDPAWRRKGAAIELVQWGLDRCREVGVPAFLEASDVGAPLYAKLGFKTVESVVMEVDGEESVFPAMMWWPPGTKEEDKRPLGG